MQNLLSILPILLIGAIVLMAGILINRAPQQTLQSALSEGVLWSACFLLSFSAEVLVLAHV